MKAFLQVVDVSHTDVVVDGAGVIFDYRLFLKVFDQVFLRSVVVVVGADINFY